MPRRGLIGGQYAVTSCGRSRYSWRGSAAVESGMPERWAPTRASGTRVDQPCVPMIDGVMC